ncbi:MAG: PKD domain-containing protein [Tepidisphaeraceae bacterium]
MKFRAQSRRLAPPSAHATLIDTLDARVLFASPSPVISSLDSTITAGQAVFVNALKTTVGAGTVDTARFAWNFGDSTGSYNTLVGFNAGHVYSKAGTYKVTLTVTNQDNVSKSVTSTVTVAAAARKAIYVSAAGSDSNDGSSSSKAVKTVAKAASLVKGKSNVDIFFRSGDTFASTATLEIVGENVRLTSYGTGNKPVIRWDGTRDQAEILRTTATANGAIVENITIDSKYKGPESSRAGMPAAIMDRGTATVVRGVTFLNIGYGLQTNSGPTGLLVQNCDSPTLYGLRSYLVWAQGTDFVILGNKVLNSTNEHPIRVYGVDRMLMAYNDVANPQAYSWETSKMALNIQKGNYVYVYDNTIRGPRVQIGPLGGADGTGDKAARLNHIVLENNTLYDTRLEIVHGANDITIRNNVFKFKDDNAMEVDGYNTEYARGVNRLNVANNTFINTGTKGRVISVEGAVGGISLVNNLYQADNMYVGTYGTAAVFVNDTSLKSFTKITNNIWPVPNVSTWVKSNVKGGTPFAIVGKNINDLTTYYTLTRWNALSQVGTDAQADVTVNTTTWAPTNNTTLIQAGVKDVDGIYTDFDEEARAS